MAALWEAGTLGVETVAEEGAEVELAAWFEDPAPVAVPAGVRSVGEEVVPAQDWLAGWRRQAAPFALGRRFFVDPGEPEGAAPAAPEGRFLLRLPARTAFGVGSHESTRLALELLEEAGPAGRRVLDVGTGTGILAFAALVLGAERVVAFDLDPIAACAAAENARLNAAVLGGRRPGLFAGEAAALGSCGFGLILLNVIPEEILPHLADVAARLAAGGELVFSGILWQRRRELVARLTALALAPVSERRAGEWVAYRLRRS